MFDRFQRMHQHHQHILEANQLMSEGLRDMWANKTPEQAHSALASPDVTVTNQKDKDEQLQKLERLSDDVKNAMMPDRDCLGDTEALPTANV